MTKKQVYEELEKSWNIFKMNNKDIYNVYKQDSVLDKPKTMKDEFIAEKIYLIECVLDQMVKDKYISRDLFYEIYNEIIKSWNGGE